MPELLSHPLPGADREFVFLGNGPYTNRGCEAIVRGTVALLRAEFGAGIRVVNACYGPPDLIAAQAACETDPGIVHIPLNPRRWRPAWLSEQAARRCRLPASLAANRLDRCLARSCAALQIGGDNYSLDYGTPQAFMELDRRARFLGAPVCLWGASVGPFDSNPEFAREAFRHLRHLDGLFVRESATRDYLAANGLTQTVFQMSDPAFLLEAVLPPAEEVGEVPFGCIGLNLSPLLARFARRSLAAWVADCAAIVKRIHERCQRPILLVPHVTGGNPESDDAQFLKAVARSASAGAGYPVTCIAAPLSAAQTKAVIALCACFAGARTHATIAAMSSLVPTVTFAYSRKGFGINADVLGDPHLCLGVAEMSPDSAAARIAYALEHSDRIRAVLRERIPEMRLRALSAGPALRCIIESAGARST